MPDSPTRTTRSPLCAQIALLAALLFSVPLLFALHSPAAAQEGSAQEGAAQEPAASPEDPVAAAARGSLGPLPTARADAYTVTQDQARYVEAPGVLRNDSERRPLIAKFVLGVEYGKLSLNKGGGFVYTPDPNFRGTDYFKYKACERARPSRCSRAAGVTLTVSGSAPVANPDSYTARKNRAKSVPAPGIVGNDADANGDPVRVISYAQPRRGGVVVGGGGNVRFVPDRNFTGRTSFRYWVGDGTGLRGSSVVTFRVRG